MPFSIKVDHDIALWRREWDERVKKQLPFALALGLTRTAQAAQAHVRGELPDTFTIRSTWVGKGIRIKPAKKKHPVAEVGSRDDFMRRQAEGGLKTSERYPSMTWDPQEAAAKRGRTSKKSPVKFRQLFVPLAARRTRKTKLTKSKLPNKALKKRRVFVGRFPNGYYFLGKRRTKARLPIDVLYVFQPHVRIRAGWDFTDQVVEAVRKQWPIQAVKALDDAINDRKPQKRRRRRGGKD